MFGRMFNKLTTLSIIFLLISIIAVPQLSIAKTEINNSCITLYVGGTGYGNYTKIQEAVDNATFGDIIYISNGTYYENIIVDESIKLIGENKTNTIIDGGKGEENKTILKVTAENVKISGFTIQNAKGIGGRAGLILNKNGNRFTRNNIFTDNIVKNCSYGVMVVNPINNIVTNNSLYGCGIGPYLTYPIYFDNQFVNNTVNDKPILLYENEENLIIDGVETDCVSLIKCKNVEIRNLNISDITVGIELSYCTKIKVINNIVSNTGRGGIYVHHSDHCTFKYNTFISDNWGIFLRKSNFNKIHYNNFINVTMPDWFASSYFNSWDSNYWGKSISGPREIFGKIGFFEKIPWYNFDQNPADEPNSLYASEKTIYVDDDGGADYKKIQDAINDANNGDTIYVYNGTYCENVVVDKSIKLIGEDKENTSIKARNDGNTIYVTADDTYISNFTLYSNGTGGKCFYNTAFKSISNGNVVTNLRCLETNFGMLFVNSNNNTIKNNYIEGYWDGIALDYSENNILRNNSMYGSGILTDQKQDIDESNTVNNKIICYYYNETGLKVPEDGGQVILIKCNNFIVENLTINGTTLGISVFDSDYNIIKNNIIYENTDFGIILNNSDYNIISNNEIFDNAFGIALAAGGLKNYEIYPNCENNTISKNNISNNLLGLMIINTNYNTINENNFIKNEIKNIEIVMSFKNNFDKNYWDDWIGLKVPFLEKLPKFIPVLFVYKHILSNMPLHVRRVPVGFIFDRNPSEKPYDISN